MLYIKIKKRFRW